MLSAVDVAAGVDTDLFLAGVLSDADAQMTLVRTVGHVHMSRQGAGTVASGLFWGLYIGQSGGGGSVRFLADNQGDISEENWLHWRVHYQLGADLTLNRTDEVVDIKAMRKLEQGKELRMSLTSIIAYSYAVALRLLMMAE